VVGVRRISLIGTRISGREPWIYTFRLDGKY